MKRGMYMFCVSWGNLWIVQSGSVRDVAEEFRRSEVVRSSDR